ncbi:unnamed protein product, partial [Ixodes pacificus]
TWASRKVTSPWVTPEGAMGGVRAAPSASTASSVLSSCSASRGSSASSVSRRAPSRQAMASSEGSSRRRRLLFTWGSRPKSLSRTASNGLARTRSSTEARRLSMASRPPQEPMTLASRYISSSSTCWLSLASRDSTNSSVASPRRPRIRYTTRIASASPFSGHHTLRRSLALTGRSRLMILLQTSSSMPLSSSSRATSSQSWQTLFLRSRIRGPMPGSCELYGLPSIRPCRKSSCCGSFSKVTKNSPRSFSS